MTLRKTGRSWAIFGPNGNQLCDSRFFRNKYEAEAWAKNYASSWLGVKLEIENG